MTYGGQQRARCLPNAAALLQAGTPQLGPLPAPAPGPLPCTLQERERARSMEQRKGAVKILGQLADRERERADAEEARRAEGEEMKRRIQALKEEEQRVG